VGRLEGALNLELKLSLKLKLEPRGIWPEHRGSAEHCLRDKRYVN
jgi:hypothetical protein